MKSVFRRSIEFYDLHNRPSESTVGLIIEQFQEKSSVEEQKSDSVSGIVLLKTLKCSLEDYDMFYSTGPSLGVFLTTT